MDELVGLTGDLAARWPTAFTERAAVAVRNLLFDLGELGYDEAAAQAEVNISAGASLASALLASVDQGVEPTLEAWEPLIVCATAVAHRQADTMTGTDLDDTLTELGEKQEWAALVPVLRRLVSGNTDLGHLDPVDTAIATELRRRILNTSTKE